MKLFMKARTSYYTRNILSVELNTSIRKNIYNSFKNNNYYILFDMTNYHKIGSYKDLIKIFPENKKQLKTYFKSNKRLIKSNYGLFMKRLVNELNHYQNFEKPITSMKKICIHSCYFYWFKLSWVRLNKKKYLLIMSIQLGLKSLSKLRINLIINSFMPKIG